MRWRGGRSAKPHRAATAATVSRPSGSAPGVPGARVPCRPSGRMRPASRPGGVGRLPLPRRPSGCVPARAGVPRPPCAPRIAVAWRRLGPPRAPTPSLDITPPPQPLQRHGSPAARVSVQLRSPWSVVGQPPRGRPVTPAPDDGTTTAGRSTEEAISCGMAAGDNTAVLRALATSIALLPRIPVAEGEKRPEDAIALPVIEQEGQRYIPVFTSEESLRAAGVDPATAVRIPVAELAANWPSDDFWLAVNPASEDGLGLPPDAVRMLPVFAEGEDGNAVEGAGPDTGTPAG